MTTPLCCPSRASILTGSFAHRTGVYKNGGNNGGADDFLDGSTLATWLQGAGYRTSLIGKYLNGYPQLWDPPAPPYAPPGWTEWRGARRVSHFDPILVEPDGMGGYVENTYTGEYFSDLLREKAKTFISDSVTAGEPFFLYLAFKAPHLPQEPATRHEGMFQTIPPWRPPSYNEADVSDKPAWVQALPGQNSADLDQIRIDQLEMLQAVDEAIGGNPAFGIVGIMEHLRNLGIADDTIVVYFADNGWYWGEHRLRAKNNRTSRSARRCSKHRRSAEARRDRFALNIDLAPTRGAGWRRFHPAFGEPRGSDARRDLRTDSWPRRASQPPVGARPHAVAHSRSRRAVRRRSSRRSSTTCSRIRTSSRTSRPIRRTRRASRPWRRGCARSARTGRSTPIRTARTRRRTTRRQRSQPEDRHPGRDQRGADEALRRDRGPLHAQQAMVVDQERRDALPEDHQRDRPRRAHRRPAWRP
jgi:hypothetical protein